MTFSNLSKIALLAAMLSSTGLALAAEIDPEDWRLDRQERRVSLEGITHVEVRNLWGEIRMRKHAKDEVYVLVNAQRHQNDDVEPQFSIETVDGVMQVKVDYAALPDGAPDAHKKRRIDMTVFLPARANARFETHHGLIQSRGLAGHVVARSVKGNISIRTAGSVDLRSDHGDVDVLFQDLRWKQPSAVETLTGPIIVNLADGGSAEVKMESHGLLASDFTMQVDLDRNTGFKRANVSVGATVGEKKGKPLLLKSARGSISLLHSRIPQPD